MVRREDSVIVTVTERGTFRRCRQMWDYASFNRQGLTSIRPPTALAFGSLVHKAHELWLENLDADPSIIVGLAANTVLDELKKTYLKTVGVEPDARELESFLDQVSLATEIFVNYKEHWGSSLPDGFTLMHAEQTIVIPIPGTDHFLEGTLDGLMRDEGGRLWVLERKTYNTKPRIDAMMMNDQFIAYLWAIRQLGIGDIGGILYDGMWKRTRETEKGKLRDLDDLFFRTPLIRSPEEIDNFERQLVDEVHDMANEPRIYRNARWEGCWDCQFQNLCVAEFRGEDSEYIREKFFTKRERTAAFDEGQE